MGLILDKDDPLLTPVMLEDGTPARLICVDRKKIPIVALAQSLDEEIVLGFDAHGNGQAGIPRLVNRPPERESLRRLRDIGARKRTADRLRQLRLSILTLRECWHENTWRNVGAPERKRTADRLRKLRAQVRELDNALAEEGLQGLRK